MAACAVGRRSGDARRPAFLPALHVPVRSRHVALKCERKQVNARATKRALHFAMSTEQTQESDGAASLNASPEDSVPTSPPAPYPGYYDDMKRMGLTEEEARAQASKARAQSSPVKSDKVGGAKSLFKEDGTPYAPWMANFPTDYDTSVVKSRTDAKGKLAADPQRAELSGVGMSWKMLGDELELKWTTGNEEDNVGFIVSRRQGKTDKWEKLADNNTAPAELASKGPEGGSYSFIVADPSPGSWVYRVADTDKNGVVSDLSQTLVEIESEQDSQVQKVALVVLVAILLAALAAGLSLDPLSSTY